MEIIKGLLKGLQIAHQDRNMILFERIKTVISMMARGQQGQTKIANQTDEDEEGAGIKENKIVMTELMNQLVKASKDQQMVKAYQECFYLLTKTYYQSGNKQLVKFLAFTYKELLKTFLRGRVSSSAISVKFFQTVFEQNPVFGWDHLLGTILKCIASTKAPKKDEKDSADLLGPKKQD